ncbi:Rho GTPase-activating protein 20 [Labeo rohita]|uniref:Rho GTPase-activating protein 20 n=1 Tax=Labeo rohita TaxID=84645 RepID=A0ABQ8M2V1_LABRO|nr:Rho GTPase-activating protein 20 [Labeo rohita]
MEESLFCLCPPPPSKSNYTNVKGLEDSRYTKMPPIELSLAGYLASSQASSCRFTSKLVGKAYVAAGQASSALHTILVLQAYQADLLKDADVVRGVAPAEIKELRCSSDLALV